MFCSILACCTLPCLTGCGEGGNDADTASNPSDSEFQPVVVSNPGFENPVLAEGKYNRKAETWGATAKQSVWHVPANAYDRVDGSIKGGDGTQVAFLNKSNRIWQDVGLIEADTVYRLTVAVGARGNDTPFGTCMISLQTKSGGSDVVLAKKHVVYGEDFPETSRSPFLDFNLIFDSRDNPNMVNNKLFIVLAHKNGGQTNFDNIRLEKKQ